MTDTATSVQFLVRYAAFQNRSVVQRDIVVGATALSRPDRGAVVWRELHVDNALAKTLTIIIQGEEPRRSDLCHIDECR